jgi:LCP family protein required for cell wall assembly
LSVRAGAWLVAVARTPDVSERWVSESLAPTAVPAQTRASTDRRRWWRVTFVGLLVAVVTLTAAGAGDYLLLNRRLHHVRVTFPGTGASQTWVIVGSDNRADVPSGPDVFGSAATMPGQRADVVLIVHRAADSTTVLSVPRDLLVSPASGQIARLTLTLNDGPQSLLDGLCTTLGIAANHLVVLTMDGFAKVVDALGGVTVQIPYPVRDAVSGLSIPRGGEVRLDGRQALALVRSRHPEQRIEGRGVAVDEDTGANDRTRWAGDLFATLLKKAMRARYNPVVAQRAAWAATGRLTTDTRTGLRDLLGLKLAAAHVVDLPAMPVPNSLAVTVSQATKTVVADVGLGHGCH